eukprot:6146945-Pyramimonas_sp.AAC.1
MPLASCRCQKTVRRALYNMFRVSGPPQRLPSTGSNLSNTQPGCRYPRRKSRGRSDIENRFFPPL